MYTPPSTNLHPHENWYEEHAKCYIHLVLSFHDDVVKWKHFPRHWPFVREIHRSPVNFPHKGQWRGALMFYSICAFINGWVNNGEAGDLRRHRAHHDVSVMFADLWCRMTAGWQVTFEICFACIAWNANGINKYSSLYSHRLKPLNTLIRCSFIAHFDEMIFKCTGDANHRFDVC